MLEALQFLVTVCNPSPTQQGFNSKLKVVSLSRRFGVFGVTLRRKLWPCLHQSILTVPGFF